MDWGRRGSGATRAKKRPKSVRARQRTSGQLGLDTSQKQAAKREKRRTRKERKRKNQKNFDEKGKKNAGPQVGAELNQNENSMRKASRDTTKTATQTRAEKSAINCTRKSNTCVSLVRAGKRKHKEELYFDRL